MKFDVVEPLGVAYNLRLKPTTGVPYSQSGFNLQEIFWACHLAFMVETCLLPM